MYAPIMHEHLVPSTLDDIFFCIYHSNSQKHVTYCRLDIFVYI